MTQSEPNTTVKASADHERRIEEAERRVIAAARAFDAFEGHNPKEMDSGEYSMHLHILRDELEDAIKALNALTTPVESLPEKVDEFEGWRAWHSSLHGGFVWDGKQMYRNRTGTWGRCAYEPEDLWPEKPFGETELHGPERLAILRTLPPEVRAAKGGGK